MNLLDLLRKLGVLRWGAKGYSYKNGQEIPAESLMDDVYNAQKDLLTGKSAGAGKADMAAPSAKSD